MIGRVVSVKMQKSAVVLVENPKRHPLYGKQYMRSKRYLVDDQMGAKDGDVVEVIKIRPISKNKHYQIKRILGTDIVSLETAQLQAGAIEAIAEVLPEKEEKVEELETDILNKEQVEVKEVKPKNVKTQKEKK